MKFGIDKCGPLQRCVAPGPWAKECEEVEKLCPVCGEPSKDGEVHKKCEEAENNG